MISVIIPVYNAEAYLGRCLDGLLAQSFADWEAICVDDGSTDESLSVLNAYSSRDSRIRVVTQKNGGASVARNTGLKNAKGDYVFFLDSDDGLVPECLEILWNEVERHPNVELVVGANKTINNDKGDARLVTYGKPCYVESNEWVRYGFFKDKEAFYVVPWNKLIKKDFLTENSLFFKEGIIHEDDHWSYYFYRKLEKMSVLDDITYLHYVVPTSVMSTRTRRKSAETILVILKDIVRDIDSPLHTLQVFKYLEYFRNQVYPFLPKSKTKSLYFWFCKELRKMGQHRIAFFWFLNWFRNYRRSELYYKMIPEAYKTEVSRYAYLDKSC